MFLSVFPISSGRILSVFPTFDCIFIGIFAENAWRAKGLFKLSSATQVLCFVDFLLREGLDEACLRLLRFERKLPLTLLQVKPCKVATIRACFTLLCAAPQRQREIFEHFLNLVRANYHRERLVSFYADRMCLTPKYLSMVVYRVSGRHAGEWIRDFVVLDAKALLQSRKYTVSQVADMLGFPNNSFFGKWFKAATGMPPRRYACGGKG